MISSKATWRTKNARSIIPAAAEGEPGSGLANVYSGMLWMLLEAPAGARRAAKYLAAAERAALHATRR